MRDARHAQDWHLLGYESDPVPKPETALDAVVKHYQSITDAMDAQVRVLRVLADGNNRLLSGKAADAVRKRADESKDTLAKTADRYRDVRDALVTYQPAIGTARAGTLRAAEAAKDADTTIKNLEQTPDSPERASKIEIQRRAIESAKAAATRAMNALGEAAEAASRTIRQHWGTDGMHTSGWDAFVYGLNKVIKVLVEILGYIGIALAALAMLFPGVGWLATAALVVGLVATLGSAVLAIQGEGSWLNVILGVVGLGAAKLGAVAGKAIAAAVKSGVGAAAPSVATIGKIAVVPAGKILQAGRNIGNFKPTITSFAVIPGGLALDAKILPGIGKAVVNGNQIFANGLKGASWSGAVGLQGLKDLSILAKFGANPPKVPTWAYGAGVGGWGLGLASGLWGLVPPSDIADMAGSPDRRDEWDGRADAEYVDLTTPQIGL